MPQLPAREGKTIELPYTYQKQQPHAILTFPTLAQKLCICNPFKVLYNIDVVDCAALLMMNLIINLKHTTNPIFHWKHYILTRSKSSYLRMLSSRRKLICTSLIGLTSIRMWIFSWNQWPTQGGGLGFNLLLCRGLQKMHQFIGRYQAPLQKC